MAPEATPSPEPRPAYEAREQNPTVERFLQEVGSGPIVQTIDARDEMLEWGQWLYFGSRDLGLFNYFRCGHAAWQTLERILVGAFGSLDRVDSLLDFASGYGRMTRFAAARFDPARIWAAEIQEGAAQFQERAFGVRALRSVAEPEDFDPGRRFSAVFAGSLFTHLPRDSYLAWLRRLLELVEPGGLLIFSTHDEATLPAGRTLPEEGFYFEAISESRALDLDDYGSVWVNEPWMAAALGESAEALGLEGLSWRRLPRALWHLQDLYVVSPRGEIDLESVAVPRGLEGAIDQCRRLGATGLEVSGWAVDHEGRDADPVVELSVGGQVVGQGPAMAVREDVGSAHGGARFSTSGWHLRSDGTSDAALASGELVTIRVRSSSAIEVLYVGAVEMLVAQCRLGDLERRVVPEYGRKLDEKLAEVDGLYRQMEVGRVEVEELLRGHEWLVNGLEEQIAAMRASRFWKLRELWFRIKRALGFGSSG